MTAWTSCWLPKAIGLPQPGALKVVPTACTELIKKETDPHN